LICNPLHCCQFQHHHYYQDIPLTRHAYKSYAPILSFYTSDRFADIAIPPSEDWEAATGEFLYIYMYIYVYMNVFIYIYIYLCIYMYVYTFVFICICMYIYTYIYIYIYIGEVFPPSFIYEVYMYICIYVYMYMYIYVHLHR
jgi:hypothetical protein